MVNINFVWTDDMSVGEETIDKQHQRLLNQVNKIIQATVFGPNSDEVKEALNFFEEYAKEHFSYEEDYMKKNGYPELEEHEKQHQTFKDIYKKFKGEYDKGGEDDELLFKIEKFLGEWWIEHIGHEDKKYHLYIDG